MCVGCREMKTKTELIRVVKAPEGEVSLDLGGKKPGRGAYICNSVICFNRANKSRALSRAFGAAIPDDLVNEIQQQMETPDGSKS